MRKAITLALATAVATGGLGLVTTSASGSVVVPDGKECTKHEYQRVEHGMSKDKVTAVIGSKGLENSGSETTTGYLYGMQSYKDVSMTAGCLITFKQGDHGQKVISKDGWFARA